jgi:hypothetical protein
MGTARGWSVGSSPGCGTYTAGRKAYACEFAYLNAARSRWLEQHPAEPHLHAELPPVFPDGSLHQMAGMVHDVRSAPAGRTHQAGPPGDPRRGAAHNHRPDPAGPRRADLLAASSGWGVLKVGALMQSSSAGSAVFLAGVLLFLLSALLTPPSSRGGQHAALEASS